MKKTLLILGISLLIINYSQAQTSFNAAGGDIESSEAKVSWSVGQTFYTADVSNISEGVQLPYEVMTITGKNDLEAISLNLVVYPNPTSDFLELKVEDTNFDFKSGAYRIADIKGSILISEKINDFQTRISMENLPKGVYLLEVSSGEKNVKTFKIVKN